MLLGVTAPGTSARESRTKNLLVICAWPRCNAAPCDPTPAGLGVTSHGRHRGAQTEADLPVGELARRRRGLVLRDARVLVPRAKGPTDRLRCIAVPRAAGANGSRGSCGGLRAPICEYPNPTYDLGCLIADGGDRRRPANCRDAATARTLPIPVVRPAPSRPRLPLSRSAAALRSG